MKIYLPFPDTTRYDTRALTITVLSIYIAAIEHGEGQNTGNISCLSGVFAMSFRLWRRSLLILLSDGLRYPIYFKCKQMQATLGHKRYIAGY